MSLEIKIPIYSRQDRHGDEFFITGEIQANTTINLKEMIGFIFMPEEGAKCGFLVFRPRKSQEEMKRIRKNGENNEDRDTG